MHHSLVEVSLVCLWVYVLLNAICSGPDFQAEIYCRNKVTNGRILILFSSMTDLVVVCVHVVHHQVLVKDDGTVYGKKFKSNQSLATFVLFGVGF